MDQSKTGSVGRHPALRQFGFAAICLLVLLGFLFRDGLLPGRTVFSNDGPLGAISAKCFRAPGTFFGCYQDLNWIGAPGGVGLPSVSMVFGCVCGPLLFSKTYAPFTLLFLGLSAWFCFRQWRLSPLACVLGAVAATLNSDFFGTACWGVASQPLSFGLDFLALAALADQTSPRRWLRVVLAGFAVGMGVMEAYDIGAIFSLMVAAFVVVQALAGEGTVPKKLGGGIARLSLVAVSAVVLSGAAVIGLVGAQIAGVAGMAQDPTTKAQRWDQATQWSLPKVETLNLVVPGLFGFRMDTPQGLPEGVQEYYRGGNYWGASGRDAAWDRYFASEKKGPPPSGFIRYGGGGGYPGVLVVLVALWAVLQAFRKANSVFGATERRLIWFWGGLAFVCLLLAYGRFAPFYQFFYALPYASTMRNPTKFIHGLEWALVILFAYGVHGLSRKCLEGPVAATRGLSLQLKTWWAKAGAFDKNWVKGSAIALAVSLVGWLIYSNSRERLVAYLQEVDFDAGTADAIAGFSIRQVGCFILLLVPALGLVVLLLSGYFSGRRARLGGILLGLLLVADLGWADVPWVITWNWVQKYATNPVIDFLRDKPYEHRVAVLPFHPPKELSLFNQLYEIEWKQQLFQYYDVQSLDVIMMPRAPVEYIAYEGALFFDGSTNTLHRLTRRWQLTNTKYLLGAAGFVNVLNQQIDPVQQRFRIAVRFDVVPKAGIANPSRLEELTAVINPEGQYAVIDFTGALPRAKLYTNWQVSTNNEATLKELASAAFDPERTVLVDQPSIAAPSAPSTLNPEASTNSVEYVSYESKRILLRAKAAAPSVLLLNDRFDPNWKVSVDGKPATLLRCNYVMRGVQVPTGEHAIEFRFAPSIKGLYYTTATVALALLLCGYLAVYSWKHPSEGAQPRQKS